MEKDNLDEYHIPKDALEKLKDPEVIRRQVKEGKTFQEIIGYSQEAMEKFYTSAHQLFLKEEYQKSADAFVFLTTLNPYVHNYWLGLGMSEQLNENYQGALLAYAMAILTDIENPITHYHSGNCYHALNDIANALQSFEMTIRCASDNPLYENVKERATRAKEQLQGGKTDG
jgi:type III secretion system low calcium response chaperone LcrH/SycD